MLVWKISYPLWKVRFRVVIYSQKLVSTQQHGLDLTAEVKAPKIMTEAEVVSTKY